MIRRRPAPSRSSRTEVNPKVVWILQVIFILANGVLAIWLPKHGSQVMWHGRFTLLGGVILAMLFHRPAPAAYAAAYIAGCEVLWRMKKADLPWEMGKYATILILGMAIMRAGKLKRSFLPAAYFLLLLPSCVLIVGGMRPDEMREQLTFNLLGPLALAVCAIFFASVPLTVQELKNTLVCLIGPAFGIAVLALESLEASQFTTFSDVSNATASGGYGPNQVSGVLGLAILSILCYLMLGSPSKMMTGFMFLLLLFMVRQVILTFSRGGLYMALGGAVAGSVFLVRDKRQRTRLLVGGAVLSLVFFALVLPRIERMTRGAVSERFGSLETTGRTELIEADIDTFFHNPVLGVGPGMGAKNRLKYFRIGTAHTEWTRMIAEHGVLGLLAAVCLFALVWQNIRRAPSPQEKAIAAAFAMYCFLHLSVDATRLVAPSFAFGLVTVTLLKPRRHAAAPAAPVIPRAAGQPLRPRAAAAR
jgi:hypothetical protein